MSSPPPLPNLTAIVVPADEQDPASIRRLVVAGGYGDVWLRAKPLPAVGLISVELFDGRGEPRLDFALLAALSQKGRAAFVHRNSEVGQALFHPAQAGAAEALWQGAPGELDDKVRAFLGHSASDIAAADDGSRVHMSFAASATVAISRGRPLAVPAGTPLSLGSFGFHDRNFGGAGAGAAEGDRVALLAFDLEALRSSWQTVSGSELAARIEALPAAVVGPLAAARAEALRDLAGLGDETPEAAGMESVRAMEMVALSEAYFFGGGDAVAYLDQRVLPLFSLASHEPQLDDPDEAEALEGRESVLAAMVEVLPYRSPEGPVLESLAPGEVRPLSPWARAGAEYSGSVLLLAADRLRSLLSAIDQRDLGGWVERFYRGWWKAQTDDPWGEEYQAWRRRLDERGAADINRFLIDWAEWRTVLELAAHNQLQPALVFYGQPEP